MPEYKTTLWIRERGATFFRLMNTITTTSHFKDQKSPNNSTPENQLRTAIEQMEGWRTNGYKHDARFKIVQTNLHDPSEAPVTKFYGPNTKDA